MKRFRPSAGFTLVELLVVIAIIGILSSIGLSTFTSAQMKSRDAKRKTHLKQLADAFEAYHNDLGQYPGDDNGRPRACGDEAIETCTWGISAMENTATGTVYMVKLPDDPTIGRDYYYDSQQTGGKNTRFQLYARLENTQDPGVPKDGTGDPQIYLNVSCGGKTCNYGVSSSNTTPETGRTLRDD